MIFIVISLQVDLKKNNIKIFNKTAFDWVRTSDVPEENGL